MSSTQEHKGRIDSEDRCIAHLEEGHEQGRLQVLALPDPFNEMVEVGDAEEERRDKGRPLWRVAAEQNRKHAGAEGNFFSQGCHDVVAPPNQVAEAGGPVLRHGEQA